MCIFLSYFFIVADIFWNYDYDKIIIEMQLVSHVGGAW